MPPVAMAAPPALEVRIDESVPVLVLPSSVDMEGLRTWFEQVMPDQAEELGGRSVRLDLGDRAVVLRELRRAILLLRERFDVDVTGLYLTRDAVIEHAQRELRLKLFVTDLEQEVDEEQPDGPAGDDPLDAPPTPLTELEIPHDLEVEDLEEEEQPETFGTPTHSADHGRRSLTLRRTLRSGTIVRFDGDIQIFGDVNPGAQVIATGHVTVLGTLKGMAWAGATGDDSATILALVNRPTQVRIGRKIAIAPDRPHHLHPHPELASILDGQIVIEPYLKGRPRTP